MAVAFDAVGPTSAGINGNPSASWTHTCVGSSKLCLVVGVSVDKNPDTGISVSATCNGVTMTQAIQRHSNDFAAGFVTLFYTLSPTTGANSIVVTASPAATVICGSVSFTGVVAIGNTTSAISTTTSVSATISSAVGNMIVDAVCNGATVTSSTQTNRWLKNFDGSTAAGNAAQSTAAGASSVTMGYTVGADSSAILLLELSAVDISDIAVLTQEYQINIA